MGDITAQDSFFKHLRKEKQESQETQWELVEAAQAGDQLARDRLVTSNLRLVVKVAKRYTYRNTHDIMDLIQVGTLGLMYAVNKYDTAFNVQFTTYAMLWVRAHILLYIKKDKKFKTQISLKDYDQSIDILETIEDNIDIDKVFMWSKEFIQDLAERDSDIIEYRILNPNIMNLQQIGDKYKVSRERVRQIEKVLREKYFRFIREKLDE